MAALHKNVLFAAQKTTISHTADAHGGFFLPVPPQQLFPSGGFLTFTLKGPWSDPVALFFCPRNTSQNLSIYPVPHLPWNNPHPISVSAGVSATSVAHSGCSPLKVFDLHTSWASEKSGGPIFLRPAGFDKTPLKIGKFRSIYRLTSI
jgi:hypothetical protein